MESSETWRTEALKSFAISKSGMQGVKDVQTGRPDRMAAEQWSGQHIWIWYAIVRVWCSRVPCASPWGSPDRRARHMSLLVNPDGVDPDSLARSVSSGRGVPTPCTRGRILSSWHSISFGYPTIGWERRTYRASTFYIRISHSWMGEEDASTSSDRHIRTFW